MREDNTQNNEQLVQDEQPQVEEAIERAGKKHKRGRRKRKQPNQVVRIEELEKILGEEGDDVDVDAIVSMYMPHRKAKNFGAALLRLDKMYLWLLGMILTIAILFIVAFMQEKMGNFTINLNRLELFRKGISIAADQDFTEATARLTANTVQDATNISVEDLPEDLDGVDGEHNGKNYMAYTYYIRNAGKEDLGYQASITLDSCSKGAENAVRVAVWENGVRTIYAEPAADGNPEEDCENFEEPNLVCSFTEPDFKVGYVNKYTIVIWLEGDDPECVDTIVGGSVEFTMNIDADYEDETNLLVKFVQDIKDTISGDKPISAAGNDAPDYYSDEEIKWKNRRNQ